MTRTMTKRFRFRFQKSERAFPFAHLSDYAVYKITNARKRYRAPFPWGICLRSTSTAPKSKITAERGETGLKVIAFHSEKSRACWLTAMRLAKVIERSFTVFPIFLLRFLSRPSDPPLLLYFFTPLLHGEKPLCLFARLSPSRKSRCLQARCRSVSIGRGCRWSIPRQIISSKTRDSRPFSANQIWLALIRFVSLQYGKQLRENYRAFKNKQCEQTDSPKDRYVNYNVSNVS